MKLRDHSRVLLPAGALLAGCIGTVGDTDATGAAVDPGPRGGEIEIPRPPPSAQLRFACGDSGVRGATNPAVRRLSKLELANTVHALLGDALFGDREVQNRLLGLPDDGLHDKATDFAPLHPLDWPGTLMGVAQRVNAILETSATERQRLFGACAAGASADAACATAFVRSFGARVYRRPLTADEEADHLAQFQAAGGGPGGLGTLLFRFLQSPALAFHLELGSQPAGGRSRLGDWEVASRVAYLTTAGPPDQPLRDAAARAGELQRPPSVRAQVERLLDAGSAAARARVRAFFDYYANLESVPDPFQGAGNRNQIVTAGLADELVREARDFADGVFWTSKGGFRELMTSRDSYPRSEALRFMLGAAQTVGPGGGPVAADADHIGFLHRPALLASVSPRTSPILRGAHVRIRYLCDKIPDPDAAAVNAVVNKLGNIDNQPNRARVEQLTKASLCTGCHSQINGLGYPFEKLDQLGVRRERELAMAADGSTIGMFDIDTHVDRPRIEANESPSFSIADSRELAQAVAEGSKGRSCFAQRLFEFTRARGADEDLDGCALSAAEDLAYSGSLRDLFVLTIANDDVFWRRAP